MKKIIFIATIIIIFLLSFTILKTTHTNPPLDEASEIITSQDIDTQKLVYVEYVIDQTWIQNNKTALKYNLKLINNSSETIENWYISLALNSNIEISQFWNSKLELNENTLNIKPETYNNLLQPHAEIELGFILLCTEDNVINSYKLYVNGEEYSEVQNNNIEIPLEENKTENVTTTTSTPLSIHGKLSVKDTNIIDKNGDVFIIQGVSTHGIAWFPQYVSLETFKTLRDDFNSNTIRIAMYSDVNSGYTTNLHELVSAGVDYATELGMYVIIDWHILSDNNPNQNKSNAIKFFTEMANKYKDNENILYEICNEPNGNVKWDTDVKPYAEELISTIRNIDNDAIIIVGTPTWCQDVDIVSKNPIKNEQNIVYALHFYAASHKQDIRNKLKIALDNKLPILVSEFGISDASGNGTISIDEGNTWINYLRQNNIGYVCWNLSNKNETSSILNPSTNTISNWTDEQLSEQGKWLKQIYNK